MVEIFNQALFSSKNTEDEISYGMLRNSCNVSKYIPSQLAGISSRRNHGLTLIEKLSVLDKKELRMGILNNAKNRLLS